MKFNTVLQVLLAAGFLGCAASANAFTPGTYEAALQGMRAPVPVSVTFSADRIEKVVIGANKETAGLGSVAIEKLPPAIVETQSIGIDAIGGATLTSRAILDGVAECIKKAGGDPKDYLKAVEKTAAGQTQNLETDLVIIGGGGSGLTAAVRSAELGTKTVVLEKMQVLGGAAGICGGQIAVQSAQIQKDLGVQDDSPAWFAYDLLANGHMRNDLTALTAYSDNLGASVDWAMKSLGMTQFEEMKLQYRGEFSKDRSLYIKGAGAGFISLLTNKLSDMPVTIKTGTKVEKILKDEKGAVVGVEATDANGTKYVVRSKAVLLATGGYGANREMLAGDLQKALYYGPVCATGDGHRMAEAAGAKLINMELGKQYPNGIEVAPGLAKSTIQGNYEAWKRSGIIVNHAGERIVNEKASNNHILPYLLKEKEATLFMFMDAYTWEGFSKNLKKTGITDEELQKWIDANGKGDTLVMHADTIEALAKLAGMDPEVLQKTVDRYNGFVAEGKDEDFGRPVEFMKKKIEQGPYWLVEQKSRFATSLGGVKITPKLEVTDTNGKAIPNLFASGEVVGGVHGTDSAAGANIAWAITSGKLAAEAIAEHLKTE